MLWMSAFRRYGPIERDFLSAKTYARQAIEDWGGPALMDAKALKLKAYLSPGSPLDFEKSGKEGLGGYSGST